MLSIKFNFLIDRHIDSCFYCSYLLCLLSSRVATPSSLAFSKQISLCAGAAAALTSSRAAFTAVRHWSPSIICKIRRCKLGWQQGWQFLLGWYLPPYATPVDPPLGGWLFLLVGGLGIETRNQNLKVLTIPGELES